MRQNKSFFFFTALFTFIFLPEAFAEVYTDESIRKMFKSKEVQKSHSLMTRERERLQAISDGFLLGDSEAIEKNTDMLVASMRQVAQMFPHKPESGGAEWTAMSEIVSHVESMKKEILNKNYNKAYSHYSRIMASCIQCHQIARSWGKFEEPPPVDDDSQKAGDER